MSLEIWDRAPVKKLHKWFDYADVLVMPSVTDDLGLQEGLGMVAVEAVFHDLPVVAYDNGGLRSVVQDGKTGFLVKEGNYHQLSVMVNRALAMVPSYWDFEPAKESFSTASIRAQMSVALDLALLGS